jgi:hypothetical protein
MGQMFLLLIFGAKLPEETASLMDFVHTLRGE